MVRAARQCKDDAQRVHFRSMFGVLISLVMSQAAGTSRNPAAAPMSMLMFQNGQWSFMLHGQAFLNHTNASGARGGEKTFSTNWVMATASRPLGRGAIAFRTMLSLEPATITQRSYPELFQTGETAFGKQLIDGQHPHDFFMELAAEYLRPVGRGSVYVYVAPAGDPAFGPVAFPHRASAAELPQAPLTHHQLDSTHISYNVITAGAVFDPVTIEASAFHGHEPDERRWDLEGGKIDSWSSRLRLQPTVNLDLQVSTAHLTHPELVEPGYQNRTSASISYTRGRWSSTAAWGRVYKEVHDRDLDGYLAESVVKFFSRHYLTARAEVAEKDELFPHPILTVVPRPPQPIRVFRVKAYTIGYTIDVARPAYGQIGLGANATRYQYPALLNGFYGEHPHTVIVYLRGRLGSAMSHHHEMM
ncbi:MAG TPA: hypothetical protein VII32_01380 [Thermoanaerobaculia bacterium]|jgi:hypothetical protein